MRQDMNYMLLAETALLAGEIMLVSGAETYRVEDTAGRILKTSGLERAEAFVVSTGIFVTLSDPQINPISMVRRVGEKNTNLGNISETNEISRRYCSGQISLEEAYRGICEIVDRKRYPEWLRSLCTILSTFFFCIILGGGVMESVLSMINGAFIVFWDNALRRARTKTFLQNVLSSLFIACFSTILAAFSGNRLDSEPMIAGSIMPLLPGVAITNAIRDTLQGDYVSGGGRIIEAFVIALSIAVGIGAGLALGDMMAGGIGI